jgi:hypothetical protein
MAIAICKGDLHHFPTEKNNFFIFFSLKRAKVHPKMCLSESLSFFNGDDILIPLYCGREKKEEFVMLANQRRCDT